MKTLTTVIKIAEAFAHSGKLYITGTPVKPLPTDFSTGMNKDLPAGQIRFSVRKKIVGLPVGDLLASQIRTGRQVRVTFEEHHEGDVLGERTVETDGWHVVSIEGIVEMINPAILSALILADTTPKAATFTFDEADSTSDDEDEDDDAIAEKAAAAALLLKTSKKK